jgi:hypothetical protein
MYGSALAWFAGHGVAVERIVTDNGSCYRSHASGSSVRSTACGICGPDLTARAPMAKPNGSSRLARASGPMPVPMPGHKAQRGIDRLARALQYRPATHRHRQTPTDSPAGPISVSLFDRRDCCFVPTYLFQGPQRPAGVRIAEGDRRQPAPRVLVAARPAVTLVRGGTLA